MMPIIYEYRVELGKGKGRVKACTTGKQFRDVEADLIKYARLPIRDFKLAHQRVIRLVIRILTEVGWTQGTCYRNERGRTVTVVAGGPQSATCFCLVGAIDMAMSMMAIKYDVQDVADNVSNSIYAALDLRYGQGEAWSRVTWNDKVYRTPEQVVSLLNVALQINL